MTQFQLGYTAALLEGEGCFSLRKVGSVLVICAMTDELPIRRMEEWHSGNVRVFPNQTGKTTWRWELYGDKAVGLMALLRPHMSPRRQARIDQCVSSWVTRVRYAPKPTCRKGHDFTPENTLMQRFKRRGEVRQFRRCKQCAQERDAAFKARHPEYYKRYSRAARLIARAAHSTV